MNKGRRQELKKLKYKKRLRLIGDLSEQTLSNPRGCKNGVHYNYTGFKNSSKPCSCCVCSPKKYNRAKVNKSEDAKSCIKQIYGMQAMAI